MGEDWKGEGKLLERNINILKEKEVGRIKSAVKNSSKLG
jgi:hypothetical protein